MSDQRKTVTLFIYLADAKTVLLSRRGKLEKYPGLIQATVHGQIEPGEISQIAMKREFEEEVKGDFHQLTKIIDLGEADVGQNSREHTFYHAAVMADEFASTLHPTQEVAEIIQVAESDIPKIKAFSTMKGEQRDDYSSEMVMFDDELEVLKKVFKEFS